jgi:glycosyltransferase involved in cell wall biosynthesis
MESRIRVLHVIQNLNYGGMERLLADIVSRTSSSVFENHVLVLQYLGRFAKGLEGCATLHTSGRLPRWTMFWPAPLAQQIRAIAPDVVHLHSGVWYKASLAAKMAGVTRVVHTEHGRRSPDPWLFRVVEGIASRRTDVVVAVSKRLATQLETTVVKGRAPIVVVPNGVDTETFSPRQDQGKLRAELGIPDGALVIGSIGRLEYIKGYDLMVDAFHRLLEHWPDPGTAPYLIIAGDGSERARLEQMVLARSLAGRAHLLGWRDDVHELLGTFSLFTMSSRSEGTSVSLLEAMSSGLCPVVTNVGGNEAVLGPALARYLVPPENPDALSSAWRTALTDPSRLRESGAMSRERVLEAYGIDRMVREYEALYRGTSA